MEEKYDAQTLIDEGSALKLPRFNASGFQKKKYIFFA